MAWNAAWDEVFQKHAWGRYPPEEVVRFIARNFYKAPNRKDVRILEVGCGPASNLWMIAREGFSVFGVDGSAVAIQNGKNRLTEEQVTGELKQGDAAQLPYPDAHFDGVLDIECLYANSKKDSKRILSEIYRVLKPGGLFFSKTFMTGSSGDEKGKRLAGEAHTFTDIQGDANHSGRGIVRFTAEEEIPELYGMFHSIEYDSLIRTDQNRAHEIKEWLITCRKNS
jgi:SAM-dependent methyltransferase